MDIKTAKALKAGDEIYHTIAKNADGTSQRFKVTSVKTWKRNPDRVEVRLKRGLYQYEMCNEEGLPLLSLMSNEEPTKNE